MVGTVISVDLFVNPSAYHADIFFPASSFTEVTGSHTNTEGRITPIRQKVTSPGTARPDWMIAAEIAHRLGHDLGIEKPEDIWNELNSRSISHEQISFDSIANSPDGQFIKESDAITLGNLEKISDTRPFDSYSLRLVLAKRMYDMGTITQMSPALQQFAGTSQLHINPSDFEAMGIQEGKPVLVSAGERSLTLLVVPAPRTPRSVAFGYLNQIGEDLRTLLSKSADSVDIRIDPTVKVS